MQYEQTVAYHEALQTLVSNALLHWRLNHPRCLRSDLEFINVFLDGQDGLVEIESDKFQVARCMAQYDKPIGH